MNVVANECGRKWMWSQMNAVSNECGIKWIGLKWTWSQRNDLKGMVSNELVSMVMEPLQVDPPLVLQQPSFKLKNKVWQIFKQENGMVETPKATRTYLRVQSIQTRLNKSVKNKKHSDQKAFWRLMPKGQVKIAFQIVDTANDINGNMILLKTS